MILSISRERKQIFIILLSEETAEKRFQAKRTYASLQMVLLQEATSFCRIIDIVSL